MVHKAFGLFWALGLVRADPPKRGVAIPRSACRIRAECLGFRGVGHFLLGSVAARDCGYMQVPYLYLPLEQHRWTSRGTVRSPYWRQLPVAREIPVSALKHGRSRCSFGLAAGCRKHHRASGLGLRAKTLNIRLRCFKSSESLKPILRRLHSSWSFCSRDFHPSVHCTNIWYHVIHIYIYIHTPSWVGSCVALGAWWGFGGR